MRCGIKYQTLKHHTSGPGVALNQDAPYSKTLRSCYEADPALRFMKHEAL